jgi:hypothetical protein
MTHASIPASERARLGLSDTLVRLSPGCEHPDDLVEDLTEGLDALVAARKHLLRSEAVQESGVTASVL